MPPKVKRGAGNRFMFDPGQFEQMFEYWCRSGRNIRETAKHFKVPYQATIAMVGRQGWKTRYDTEIAPAIRAHFNNKIVKAVISDAEMVKRMATKLFHDIMGRKDSKGTIREFLELLAAKKKMEEGGSYDPNQAAQLNLIIYEVTEKLKELSPEDRIAVQNETASLAIEFLSEGVDPAGTRGAGDSPVKSGVPNFRKNGNSKRGRSKSSD